MNLNPRKQNNMLYVFGNRQFSMTHHQNPLNDYEFFSTWKLSFLLSLFSFCINNDTHTINNRYSMNSPCESDGGGGRRRRRWSYNGYIHKTYGLE